MYTFLFPPWVTQIFFFKFELHQNGALFTNFEVQFVVINDSFETEFWYMYICMYQIYCCEYFFLQEIEAYY